MSEGFQKEQIAAAFQRHFLHHGFKKTSVDEISSELHVSKKTIYQFFDTKEEIFFFVIRKIAGQYMSRMEADISKCETASQKLETLIRLIFTESRKWLKSNDVFEFKYKYEISELAFKEAYGELISRIVQSGMNTGEFSHSPLELTKRLIQGMISESMRLLASNPDQNPEDQVVASILKILK